MANGKGILLQYSHFRLTFSEWYVFAVIYYLFLFLVASQSAMCLETILCGEQMLVAEWIVEFQIGLHDLVFLLSGASLCPTFLRNCGWGDCLTIRHTSYSWWLEINKGMHSGRNVYSSHYGNKILWK